MLEDFRKYYYVAIYELFKNELKKIADEFNLDYQKLEDDYLSDFKKYLD